MRASIRTADILDKLTDYVTGKADLNKDRQAMALNLLNKVLPDLPTNAADKPKKPKRVDIEWRAPEKP